MADFQPAFEKMIANEGGYKLHHVKGDRGGQTYAGIARNYHEKWPGWRLIDANELNHPDLPLQVGRFYKKNFWDKVNADQIESQVIADSLFDFAVNAGYKVAVKLAQSVLELNQDGIIGPISLAKLNACDDNDFKVRYALAKIARYAEIVNRDKSQKKFLLGWINRTLKDVV